MKLPLLKVLFFIGFLLLQADQTIASLEQLEGEHIGCPTNSICSKNMGKLHLKWLKTLERISKVSEDVKIKQLKAFQKEHGLPLSLWPLGKISEHANVIAWSSHYREHFGKNYHYGIQFVKKIENTNSSYWESLILVDQDKPYRFLISRGTRPISYKDGQLIFEQEYEGHYYYISLTTTGSIEVVTKPKVRFKREEIVCPTPLVNYFKSFKIKPFLPQKVCYKFFAPNSRAIYRYIVDHIGI